MHLNTITRSACVRNPRWPPSNKSLEYDARERGENRAVRLRFLLGKALLGLLARVSAQPFGVPFHSLTGGDLWYA